MGEWIPGHVSDKRTNVCMCGLAEERTREFNN